MWEDDPNVPDDIISPTNAYGTNDFISEHVSIALLKAFYLENKAPVKKQFLDYVDDLLNPSSMIGSIVSTQNSGMSKQSLVQG